jgi:nucleoid-associated protein YgaU
MPDAENSSAEWGENEQAEAASAPAASPEVTHTVKAGDTLSKLAREYYGDDKHHRRIFEANRDKLDDPDDIKVGQELKIPPATE